MRVVLVGAELEENLSVRYLWGALERAGHEVSMVAFNAPDELARAARDIARSGAALAAFSMVFTARAREFAELAQAARAVGFRGHLTAGGHFAAFHAAELLRDVSAFDSIGIGEGEELLVALAANLNSPEQVSGLVWRDGDRIVQNPPAEKPVELDSLAPPRRKEPPDDILSLPIVNLLGSRGCTHACAFCSIAAWHRMTAGPRLRVRAPERVAEEIATLYRQGVRVFNFHDDNFFLPRRDDMLARVRALTEALDRRGVGRIAFAVKARPGSVDEELFSLLRDAGMFRVFLGIEAGTDDSLRRLGRGQTFADNERAPDIVHRLDLHACFNLLLLNPDSTLEDLEANVAFLRAHPRNPMNFCRTEVYAGTPLERKLMRAGRLEGSYWGWDYRIADPRAQRAFEVITRVFETRNYGLTALHHLTMAVDYEHQLLAHFFGRDDGLRQRVKQFIVEVNHNTCGHLERLVDGVRRSEALDALTSRLARSVEKDNRRLSARAYRLLAEIRHRAAGPSIGRSSPARAWARRVAVVGAAATLGLPAVATEPGAKIEPMAMPEVVPTKKKGQRKSDHAKKPPVTVPYRTEMAPEWRTQVSEMAPSPTPWSPAPMPPRLPLGDASLLKPQFARETLPSLAPEIPLGDGFAAELWTDYRGCVIGANVLTPSRGAVPMESANLMHDLLMTQCYDFRVARDKFFVFSFTPEEVDQVCTPEVLRRRKKAKVEEHSAKPPSESFVKEMLSWPQDEPSLLPPTGAAPSGTSERDATAKSVAFGQEDAVLDSEVYRQFVAKTLPLIRQQLPKDQPLEIEMLIAADGSVAQATVLRPYIDSEATRKALHDTIAKQHYELAHPRRVLIRILLPPREKRGP